MKEVRRFIISLLLSGGDGELDVERGIPLPSGLGSHSAPPRQRSVAHGCSWLAVSRQMEAIKPGMIVPNTIYSSFTAGQDNLKLVEDHPFSQEPSTSVSRAIFKKGAKGSFALGSVPFGGHKVADP